jgi:hypothetical protein
MTITISYEPFDKLIISLRADGLLKESDILHHRIHKVAWTTSSELFEELGQVIKKIRQENPPSLSDVSKEHVSEAIEMVKSVLPDFPE